MRRWAHAAWSYARVAWWGGVAPLLGVGRELLLVQAVVTDARGRVLLGLRSDIHGWELPGGQVESGETLEAALRRELHEETGVELGAVEPVVEYVRRGFRPHRVQIFRCPVDGDPELVPSYETLELAWFAPDALPDGLLPWYRGPLADALAEPAGPLAPRHERWGLAEIVTALRIDVRERVRRR